MEGRIGRHQHLHRPNSNSSNISSGHISSPSPQPTKNVVRKHIGSLEIIEGAVSDFPRPDSKASENGSRPPSQRSWSRSSIGSVPPRPDSSLSRRLNTPTKQISLQAVKRKEESDEPFMPDIDFQQLNLDKSYNTAWNLSSYSEYDITDEEPSASSQKQGHEPDLHTLQHATQLRLPTQTGSEETDEQTQSSGTHANHTEISRPSNTEHCQGGLGWDDEIGAGPSGSSHEQGASGGTVTSQQRRVDGATQEDDGDSEDSSSEEEEERRAPNELLMEFVECLMKKDYKNADKLCKMILLYEPTNPEALKFKPVIEEKLRLDEAAEAEENNEDNIDDNENDEEDEDEDGDDDDDDDDDDSSSGDDDSDDSDEEEEESVFRLMAEAVASNYYASQDPAGGPGMPDRQDSGLASDNEP